jgi:hypothetical protein
MPSTISSVVSHAFGFFDGDDAFLADLFHGFGNDLTDCIIVVCGNGPDLGDLLFVPMSLEIFFNSSMTIARSCQCPS